MREWIWTNDQLDCSYSDSVINRINTRTIRIHLSTASTQELQNYAASTSIKYKQQRMRMAHKITQQYIKVLAKLFLLYVYYDRIQNAIHLEISPMCKVPR